MSTVLFILGVITGWIFAGAILGLILGPRLREMSKHYPEVKRED